jgi:xylan 1,4-beta-xylosidase
LIPQVLTNFEGNYAGIAPYLHGPLYAANATGATVLLAGVPGGQGDPTTDSWLPVWTYAEEADLIIYAGGIDDTVEAEGMDRNNIDWTGAQLDIIGQLAAYGKPMIVLQMGDQIDNSPIISNENISALIWGGYPGQSGGDALFDIIQGKAAPAGRLPVTQYPSDYIAQIPVTDMSLRPNKTSGSPGRTYQWYTGKPIFEFGNGLHYTNFTASIASSSSAGGYGGSNTTYSISDLTTGCNETYQDRCAFKTFAVDVKNTGSVTSDYVTLGFLAGQHGPEPYPIKRLVAYQRLHNITAGSTQTASLNLTLGSLARVDDNGNTVLYPGDYSLQIDTQPLSYVNFTLTGSEVVLDHWPQPPADRFQTSEYFVGGYGSTYAGEILIDGEVEGP